MNVGDVVTRAIQEYYVNAGTSSDSLTPVMVAHWIQKSLMWYWGVFQDNEFGYFATREQTLSVTPSNNIYSMPNGSTSKTTVAFSGTPTSGTLTLSINGVAVAIAYNETAAALQTTLNNAFSPSAIAVTGGPAPTTFTIDWGFLVTAASVTTNTLSGNSLTINPTIVTTNLNVAFITNMAFRNGSSPQYTYFPIPTILPSQKYQYNGVVPILPSMPGVVTGGAMSWCYENGVQDSTSQYPTMAVRFVPWPQDTNTVVYDCVRYPNQIMFDATGQPITTQILDLPLHFHDGVVLYVLREAYLRMKADTTEIEKLLADFNKSQFNAESRSLQRQGPEIIKIVW